MCCRKKTYERQKDWESPEIFTWQKRLRTCWERDSSSSIPTWSLLKRVYRLKRNTKRDTQCSIWIQRDACCRMATHEQRCNSKARRSIEQGFVCSPSPSTAYKKLLKQLNKCVQTVEQRKLDAVCQRKKNANRQKTRLDHLKHMTRIPYITIRKTGLHIMSYNLYSTGWKLDDRTKIMSDWQLEHTLVLDNSMMSTKNRM